MRCSYSPAAPNKRSAIWRGLPKSSSSCARVLLPGFERGNCLSNRLRRPDFSQACGNALGQVLLLLPERQEFIFELPQAGLQVSEAVNLLLRITCERYLTFELVPLYRRLCGVVGEVANEGGNHGNEAMPFVHLRAVILKERTEAVFSHPLRLFIEATLCLIGADLFLHQLQLLREVVKPGGGFQESAAACHICGSLIAYLYRLTVTLPHICALFEPQSNPLQLLMLLRKARLNECGVYSRFYGQGFVCVRKLLAKVAGSDPLQSLRYLATVLPGTPKAPAEFESERFQGVLALRPAAPGRCASL